MKRGVVVAVASLLLLAGCGGSDSTDPRYGRVVIDQSNCLWGECFVIWKACAGPNLLVHNSEASKENKERWFDNSPECAIPPDPAHP